MNQVHPTPQARVLNHYLKSFFAIKNNQKSPSGPKSEPGARGRVWTPKPGVMLRSGFLTVVIVTKKEHQLPRPQGR